MFDPNKLDKASDMLKAIAHPIRMNIIDLLKEKRTLTVTEIFEYLELEQSVVSHHLRILKDRDVLSDRRDGKNRYYSLKHERLTQVIDCIGSFCGQ